MAGRPKQGIDYAGWSVNIFDGDTKIDKLLDAQGWIGWSIYFYLCQMAYKFDGYFYRWTYDDSATTARRMGGGIRSETVRNTVGLCLQIGLFDKPLFDRDGILTSRGIQRRFYAAIQGRRVKSVIADYWLLENEESKGLEMCALNAQSTAIKTDLQGANDDMRDADAHKRKEEESKVKESKAKERKDDPSAGATDASGRSSGHGSAVSFFLDRVNPMASNRTLELLADFERDLGPEVCIRAMMVALDAGKGDWGYIQGILKNKRRTGIRSLAAWDAQEAERARRRSHSGSHDAMGDLHELYQIFDREGNRD